MYINWGAHHSSFSGNGEDLQLVLDQTSGSAVKSKRAFLFGSIEMLIKLVPGNSAGTVTTYYLSYTGDKHDEIDYEFLGNVSGQPYIVTQTSTLKEKETENSNSTCGLTQLLTPYTGIPWHIDNLPICVFRNYENEGIAFPNKQGMRVYSSLWNADNWATRGGLEKIDWKSAPFIAKLRRFRARACKWKGPVSINQCASKSPANWWTSPSYSQLSSTKFGQMKWDRDNFMIYDY
ncbi:hypothetical protein PTKIN_Ptkin19aG0062700 [Pterospermum kingtungense]